MRIAPLVVLAAACAEEIPPEPPACPFLGSFDVVEWGPLDVADLGWTMEFVDLEDQGCDLYVEADSSYMVQLWRKREDGDGWAFDVYDDGDAGTLAGRWLDDETVQLDGDLRDAEDVAYLLELQR